MSFFVLFALAFRAVFSTYGCDNTKIVVDTLQGDGSVDLYSNIISFSDVVDLMTLFWLEFVEHEGLDIIYVGFDNGDFYCFQNCSAPNIQGANWCTSHSYPNVVGVLNPRINNNTNIRYYTVTAVPLVLEQILDIPTDFNPTERSWYEPDSLDEGWTEPYPDAFTEIILKTYAVKLNNGLGTVAGDCETDQIIDNSANGIFQKAWILSVLCGLLLLVVM